MIVVLTGAPGAGKGTQADLLALRDGFKKISTGDALRTHIKSGTPIGLKARAFMDEGKLVPDEVLLEILKSEFESAKGQRILLDGYPRNRAQAEFLAHSVGQSGISACVHLDVEPSLLIGRISGRRTCSSCGASYHVLYSPSKVAGICDRCGAETIQRPDDDEAKVRVRLEVYEKDTKPILDFYKASGLYRRVEGTGSTEDVYQRIRLLIADVLG